MTGRVELRERSAGACADLGVALLRDLGTEAIEAWWPAGLVSLGIAVICEQSFDLPWLGPEVLWLLGYYAGAPVTRVIGTALIGARPAHGIRAASAAILRRLRGVGIDLLPILACATCIGFPVAVWLWTARPFTGEILLLEPPGTAILARGSQLGRDLSRGLALRIAEVALVVWAVITAESVGQFVVAGLLQAGTPWGDLWQGDATPFVYLGLLASQPALATVRAAFYLDARVRAESLDRAFALWRAFGGDR